VTAEIRRLWRRDELGLLDRLIQVSFGAAPPTRLLAPLALDQLLLSRPPPAEPAPRMD
jgi:hypothetical protein